MSVSHSEFSLQSRVLLPARARILVVRPDRLGDMLLSTPVLEVLRRFYPKSRITVLAQPRVAPVLEGLDSVDEVLRYEPEGRHSGWRGFRHLTRDLRSREFDLALVLQAPAKVAWALLAARIPVRVGPLSKSYSFFTYNHGIRQRRSQVEMHEADYNLQLLRPLGVEVGARTVSTRAAVSEEARREVARWCEAEGIDASRAWLAVHPGMGGSALNWPEEYYTRLVAGLLDEGRGVVLTGGPTEQGLLERLAAPFQKSPALKIFGGASAADIQRLGALYQKMRLVIAPSTGPLHLAVAMGRPVVTFYPPIRVQSAKRWGPYLVGDHGASILTPEVYCGQEFRCLGERCVSFPCMKTISVDRVHSEIHALTKR